MKLTKAERKLLDAVGYTTADGVEIIGIEFPEGIEATDFITDEEGVTRMRLMPRGDARVTLRRTMPTWEDKVNFTRLEEGVEVTIFDGIRT